jgi:hypothetical protein
MAPLQDRSVFKEEVALLISTYGNTIPIDEAVAEGMIYFPLILSSGLDVLS